MDPWPPRVTYVGNRGDVMGTSPFLMPYSMTKFALSAAAAGLRQELAELDCGVRCSVVERGAYHTGSNQKMAASKYDWMRNQSYFRDQIPVALVIPRRLTVSPVELSDATRPR